MQRANYTAEFKKEAVRQVIDRGNSVIQVAKRLGIGDVLLYTLVGKCRATTTEPVAIENMKSMQVEPNRLKAELRCTRVERYAVKKGRLVLSQTVGVKYAFCVKAQKAANQYSSY